MKTIQLIFLLLTFFGYSAKSGTTPCALTVSEKNTFIDTGRTIISLNDDEWVGIISTDWNDAGNWFSGTVPTAATNVTIKSGASFYPEVNTTVSVNNLILETGGILTISGGTLQIAADITNSGVLDVANGSIEMIGSSAQTIPADAFLNNILKNLIVSNDVTLDGSDTLTGTLTIAAGKTFTTNDNLVLRSDANGTARIAALSVDGSGNATAFITGRVSIERYIPMRKAWRLLSVPVKTSGAPSINDAFQEGVGASSLNDNPNPGYGVFIIGGSPAHGFDQGPTNNTTIKVFDNASNNFVKLPVDPGTMRPITDYPGYFLYIRGDRGINLMMGNSAEITPTTLRIKGWLNTGDVTSDVNATGYTVFGNPFPSAIDFETLTKNNVKNSFYVWDPKLSGTFGLGGYVTFSWNSGTGTYDATTSASPLSKYIPSGEAIIIESDDATNPGTITVKESDKTANGSDDAFGRPAIPVTVDVMNQQVRVNLYSLNTDGTTALLDGVLTTYEGHNSNNVDNNDAKKLNGGSENIGIKTDNKMLSIERRKTITATDTTYLNIYQMKIANYQLQITADNMNKAAFTAVIKDKYSNTINNMPLDMNGMTKIDFSINADPASYAINRFSIVFMPKKRSQLAFYTQKAYRQKKDIAVEWKMENENNIREYEVERSADGKIFTRINTTLPIAKNDEDARYKIIDAEPMGGDNYYRIHSVEQDGKTGYSAIVKVDKQDVQADPSVVVYPNPVTGNAISIQLNNIGKGNYIIQLFNSAGQLTSVKSILHDGKKAIVIFDVDKKFAAGKYELMLTGEGIKLNIPVIKR